MISFRSSGRPLPLKRHRLTRGKRMYDPSHKDKKEWMNSIKDYHPIHPLESVLELKIIFYFRRPKCHYGTGRNSNTLKKSAPKYMNRTPDIDNLIKFYLDAMNGVFFKDDRQIISIISEKKYCPEEGEQSRTKPGYVDIFLKDLEHSDYHIPTNKNPGSAPNQDNETFLLSDSDSDL